MRVTNFQGMQPKVDPRNLGPNAASYAEDCTFQSGAITPLRGLRLSGSVVTVNGDVADFEPKTLHKAGGVWVGWEDLVPVAKDPLRRGGEDAFLFVQDGKLYRSSGSWITDGEGPAVVGVQRPCEAPGATSVPGCDWFAWDGASCYERVFPREICDENQDAPIPAAFLYTYVNACDEESAPSPPTEPVLMYRDEGALVSATDDPPPGATHRRWYALLIGSDQSSGWFLFAEEPVATPSVIYCPGAYEHDDLLRTEGWEEVPACVDGVALAGDATTVLWHGRELFLSEPRQPHAYPARYVKRVDYPITQVVTLTDAPEGATHYSAVILTTGCAYLLTGDLPENMVISKIPREAPHLNPGRAVAYAGVVLFASYDGIYSVAGGRVTNLTASLWSRDTWREVWHPEASIGYADNCLLVVSPASNSDGQGRSFLLPWSRQDNPYPSELVWLSLRASALYFSEDVPLHVTGRGVAYEWAASDQRLRAVWRSPVYTQRALWHPTAAKVLSDAARVPPDAQLWANKAQMEYRGVPTADEALQFLRRHPDAAPYLPYLRHPANWFRLLAYHDEVFGRPVWSDRPFRLKRDRRLVEWSFEVSGSEPIYEVHVQTSMEDLGQEGGHG